MNMVKLFVPFEKVDVAAREVWGFGTVEEVDTQKEVVSIEGSERAFEKWSKYFEKVTGGKSRGNIREMHNRVAAGKVIAWDVDHEVKGIFVGGKVIDDAAWAKCEEGVYTGFSIGGKPTKTHREKREGQLVTVIDEYDLVELSLVDNPSSPSSTFSVVKSATGGKFGKAGIVPIPNSMTCPGSGETPASDPLQLAKATILELMVKHATLVDRPLPAPVPVTLVGPIIHGEALSIGKPAIKKQESTEVAALLFDKDTFSADEALAWARDHDFAADKVDSGKEDAEVHRVRQKAPGDFKEGSLRTIDFGGVKGVQAVVGRPKITMLERMAKVLDGKLLKNAIRSHSMTIHPTLSALREIAQALDTELLDANIYPETAGMAKADAENLTAAAHTLIEVLEAALDQQLAGMGRPEGLRDSPTNAKAIVEQVNALVTMSKMLSPAQLKKVGEDEEIVDNMTKIHKIGHQLVDATTALGAECPGGICKQEDEETDETEEIAEVDEETDDEDIEKQPPKPGEEPDEEEEDEEKRRKIATPAKGGARKAAGSVSVVKEIRKVGAGVGEVKAGLDSLDARVARLEKAPARIGRPVGEVKKIGPAGIVEGSSSDTAEVLAKMAETEKDPKVKEALLLRASSLDIQALQAR